MEAVLLQPELSLSAKEKHTERQLDAQKQADGVNEAKRSFSWEAGKSIVQEDHYLLRGSCQKVKWLTSLSLMGSFSQKPRVQKMLLRWESRDRPRKRQKSDHCFILGFSAVISGVNLLAHIFSQFWSGFAHAAGGWGKVSFVFFVSHFVHVF